MSKTVTITDFWDYDIITEEVTYKDKAGTVHKQKLTAELFDLPMTDESRRTMAQILKIDEFHIVPHVISEKKFSKLMSEFGL